MGAVSSGEVEGWIAALSAIARTGLAFTESLYEHERYEEILKVVAKMELAAGKGESVEGNLLGLIAGVGRGVAGYVTPKCAVGAVVVDSERRILLVQRSDSGVWLYPTGWADVGYSAAEVVVKEVKEETGIDVEPVSLLGVVDGMQRGFTSIPMYSMVFLCKPTGGELVPHPLETSGAGWFSLDDLPPTVAYLAGLPWLRRIFDLSHEPAPFFDPPRD